MLKGWKTITFNILTAIFSVLEVSDFTDIVPASWQGGVVTLVALVNIFLRMNTNTPIGRKD